MPIRNETDNLDYLFEEQSFFLMLSDSPNVSPRYNLSAEVVWLQKGEKPSWEHICIKIIAFYAILSSFPNRAWSLCYHTLGMSRTIFFFSFWPSLHSLKHLNVVTRIPLKRGLSLQRETSCTTLSRRLVAKQRNWVKIQESSFTIMSNLLLKRAYM